MDFRITQGLATYDYVDHYAILGVPITADAGEIRRRYMHIVRSLHPDSRAEANKELASQFLSKLVNPSYKVLSQERERTEYLVLLRLLGQRLAQGQTVVQLQTQVAQQFLQTLGELDIPYRQAIQALALSQYESLEQTLALTGQLSELNLVYLQRQEVDVPPAARVQPVTRVERPTTSTGEAAPLDTAALYASQYHRRAQELIAKNNFQAAMVELRDALKLDPDNSQCHSLLGTLYLKLNQLTMARVHFNQALKFDPRNAAALTGKQQVEKLERQSKGSQPRGTQKPSGGLFGLFGSRKK